MKYAFQGQGQTRPEWMTPEQYANAPDAITLREVKVAHQVLVTTLLDHRRVSKADLSALYARRWNVELDLRNLKTTTGMDVLSCQTPTMNDKQLWVHLLAYNVIRLLMAQAACNANVDPRSLSFKHTVQLCGQRGSREDFPARMTASVCSPRSLNARSAIGLDVSSHECENDAPNPTLGSRCLAHRLVNTSSGTVMRSCQSKCHSP